MMPSVDHTTEFARVAALPRRDVTRADADAWSAMLTPRYATSPGVRLRPWQAVALAEAVINDGAWLALPVGTGKTLITWLLPTAMASERALLIVPGSLMAKTRADFADYARDWVAPRRPLRIETREKLASVGGRTLLTDYRPDLIAIDEADGLANPRSSAARRVDRYVIERGDAVRVVTMTGTPARKSILNYWHHLAWTLGEGAPVPLVLSEARMWALALDDHRGKRPDFGPLGHDLASARDWYRRRLVQTPGVVVVDEDSCDQPLTIRTRLARECATLDEAFARFAIDQESPGGEPVSDPLSLWRLDAQLGLGLYKRWNPEPPERWRDARRAVARFVRDRIDASTHYAHPLDTEAQVLARYDSIPVVTEWRAVKPTFRGRTETVWLSRATLDSCLDWLRESAVPGIVWSGCVDFGRALARDARLAYYSRKGMSDDGVALHEAPRDRSFVASWNANKLGQNLQAWTRQLVTMPPQSSKYVEQIIGRSHRGGQTQPVTVDVLATSGGTLDGFASAMAEATKVRDTESLTQKILRARIVHARPTVTPGNEFRWARRTKDIQ